VVRWPPAAPSLDRSRGDSGHPLVHRVLEQIGVGDKNLSRPATQAVRTTSPALGGSSMPAIPPHLTAAARHHGLGELRQHCRRHVTRTNRGPQRTAASDWRRVGIPVRKLLIAATQEEHRVNYRGGDW